MSNFTPEQTLLLACARLNLEEKESCIKELLSKPLEWTKIVEMARRHGLVPLLYRALLKTGAERVPHDILVELRDQSHAIGLQNLRMAYELAGLAASFAGEGIPALAHRGAVVAEEVYCDLSLRPFCDIDLLIHPDDLPRARQLLEAHGYERTGRLEPKMEQRHIRMNYCLAFNHPGKNILVELHYRVAPRFLLRREMFQEYWPRRRTLELQGKSVQILAQEDAFAAAALHGAKHIFGRLIWLVDVAEMLRKEKSCDFARILEQADRTGTRKMVLLGCHLAHILIGVELPETVEQAVRCDTTATKMAGVIQEKLFAEKLFFEIQFWHGLVTYKSYYQLRMRERLRDKLGFIGYKMQSR